MAVPIQAIRIETEWNGAAVSARHWITLHLFNHESEIELRVSAPFYNDPPAPTVPIGPTDRLWEHEVVELFFHGVDDRYTEIELSPSGHHLVLQLHGVRNMVSSKIPIQFQATTNGERWTGTARIKKHLLPDGPHRINATAIHGSGNDRMYLSWVALPGTEPDFHQPQQFRPLVWVEGDDQRTERSSI